MSKIKKNEPDGCGGSWLTTMSYLMQVLLTFFIFLYSMSNLDAEKFAATSLSIQDAFIGSGSGASLIQMREGNKAVPGQEDTIAGKDKIGIEISPEIIEIYEKVETFIEENELQENVDVRLSDEGVFVDIKEVILFESGKSNLRSEGIGILNDLQPLINEFENDIVIEGHTDNVPTNSAIHATNWELSTARAVSVVRYLSEKANIDPHRLSARGYGEYSPIAPNDTPENRTLNRRVNLFIVFDYKGGN